MSRTELDSALTAAAGVYDTDLTAVLATSGDLAADVADLTWRNASMSAEIARLRGTIPTIPAYGPKGRLSRYEGDIQLQPGQVIRDTQIMGMVKGHTSRVNPAKLLNCWVAGPTSRPSPTHTTSRYLDYNISSTPPVGGWNPVAQVMVTNWGDGVLIIEDTLIQPVLASPWLTGVQGRYLTMRRSEIASVSDQLLIHNKDLANPAVDTLIEDCLFHKNVTGMHDPHYGKPYPEHTHTDNIQIEGGTNITIRRTVLKDAYNACIMATGNTGPIENLLVEAGFMDGGQASVNIADNKARGAAGYKNCMIRDVTFGYSQLTPTKATNWIRTGPIYDTFGWENNRYVDGTPVAKRKG